MEKLTIIEWVQIALVVLNSILVPIAWRGIHWVMKVNERLLLIEYKIDGRQSE